MAFVFTAGHREDPLTTLGQTVSVRRGERDGWVCGIGGVGLVGVVGGPNTMEWMKMRRGCSLLGFQHKVILELGGSIQHWSAAGPEVRSSSFILSGARHDFNSGIRILPLLFPLVG